MSIANPGFILATPIDSSHHVLSAHAHNLAQYIGKGRQCCSFQIDVDKRMQIQRARAGYVLYRALVMYYVR
jgi:hypothetical protein